MQKREAWHNSYSWNDAKESVTTATDDSTFEWVPGGLDVELPQTREQIKPTPTPKKFSDTIPAFHEYYMGFVNAKSILSGTGKLSDTCRNAIASSKEKDPLRLLESIRSNGRTSYAPDQLLNSRPNVAAATTGTGGSASIKFYARYFSIRKGSSIIVDGRRIRLDRVESQALTWLHELSHATGKYDHEIDGVGKSYDMSISDEALDAILYKNCIKGAKLDYK